MAWYIESDPFLALRPFPENPSNGLVEHWHEIAFFTIFFHLIMKVAPVINSQWFGKFYDDLSKTDKKAKLNYDIRIVGLVFSIMSVLFCIPMFMHPDFHGNPIQGEYPFASFVTSVAVGYFIWDLFYCCIIHYDLFGFEFLFHAFGALLVFGTTYIPFCQPFLCSFLVFEASTPFVQLHWMFTRAPKGMFSPTAITINGVFLISTFFFSRILWGVYATYKSFVLCWPLRNEYPSLLIPTVYLLNGGFQFLNFMWFSKMFKLAKRMVSPPPPQSKKVN